MGGDSSAVSVSVWVGLKLDISYSVGNDAVKLKRMAVTATFARTYYAA